MKDRKIGKLVIRREFYTKEFMEKLPRIHIFDIHYEYYKDSFEIVCEHASFSELPEGSEVPHYNILFTGDVFYGFEYAR